jgi:hypothetical protein
MQLDRLQRIAELSGGKCLSMLQVDELLSLVDRDPHRTTITTQIPLWDNTWMMVLLVVLMGTEWIVRRRYDLP